MSALCVLLTLMLGLSTAQSLKEIQCNLCTDPKSTCSSMVSCMNVKYRGSSAYIRVLGKQKSEWPVLTEGMASQGQTFGFFGTLRSDTPYNGVITTFCIFTAKPNSAGCDGAREIYTLATDCVSSPLFPGLAFGNGVFKLINGCNGNTGMFYPTANIPAMPDLGCGECNVTLDGKLNCTSDINSCSTGVPCANATCVMQGANSQCRQVAMSCPAGMTNVGFTATQSNPFKVGGESNTVPSQNGVAYYDQGACCQEKCSASATVCSTGFYVKTPDKLCPTGRCTPQVCCVPMPNCTEFSCAYGFENLGGSVFCVGACNSQQCCAAMPKCSSIKCSSGFQNLLAFNEDKICRAAMMESATTHSSSKNLPTLSNSHSNPHSTNQPTIFADDSSSNALAHLRRRIVLATGADAIPYCSHDTCCVATSTCVSRVCGPRAYRHVSLDKVCRGQVCPFDDCCKLVPKCNNEPCGYGYVPSFLGQPCGPARSIPSTASELTSAQNDYYLKTPQCSFRECCDALPKCVDLICDLDSVRIKPNDHICSGKTCAKEECCEAIPKCTGAACGYGFAAINQGQKCGSFKAPVAQSGRRREMLQSQSQSQSFPNTLYTPVLDYNNFPRPSPCKFEECCQSLPRCGEGSCGLNSYRTQPENFALESGKWTWSACCAELPKCPASGDTCGAGFRPKNQGFYCKQSIGGNASTTNIQNLPVVVDDDSSVAVFVTRRQLAGGTDVPKTSLTSVSTPVSSTPASSSGVWKPTPCEFSQCCERIPVCSDIDCGAEGIRVKAPTFVCSGKQCLPQDCCSPRPKCQSSMCSSAFIAINTGKVCGLGTTPAPASASGVIFAPPCRLEDCCQAKGTCKNVPCDAGMYRSVALTQLCAGAQCKVEECCQPLPQCGVTSDACTYGFKAIHNGTICPQSALFESGAYQPGVWKPEPCAYSQCCERQALCSDLQCGVEAIRVVAPSTVCVGDSCSFDKCCEVLPKCMGVPCGNGWKPIHVGRVCNGLAGYSDDNPVPKGHRRAMAAPVPLNVHVGPAANDIVESERTYARPAPCPFEECCERIAQCGDKACPPTHYPVASPSTLCLNGWSTEQCCAPLPSCKGDACGYGWQPINEGMMCHQDQPRSRRVLAATYTFLGSSLWTPQPCSWSECCKRMPMCAAIDCDAQGAARIKYPQAVCTGERCTFEECCALIPTCAGDSEFCGAGAKPINKNMKCGVHQVASPISDGSDSAFSPDDGQNGGNGRRRMEQYSLSYPLPAACKWEECCVRLARCGDMQCGNGAYKTKDNDKICTGTVCTFRECCADLPRCDGSQDTCGSGYSPINQGKICQQAQGLQSDVDDSGPGLDVPAGTQSPNGKFVPGPCQKSECCARLPRCGDITCSRNSKKLAPDNTLCAGKDCLEQECCRPMNVCDDRKRPCPSGYLASNAGAVCQDRNLNDFKSPRECDLEECCKRQPTCKEVQCSTTQARKRHDNFVCVGNACTTAECCVSFPVCLEAMCDASLQVPKNVAVPCINQATSPFVTGALGVNDVFVPTACRKEDCCAQRGNCTNLKCPNQQVNIGEGVKCTGAQCMPQECCAALDQFGRPVGFGNYMMPDQQTCEFWGCAMLVSKDECQFAATVLKMPDSQAAAATKTSSPAGCYFRPEWQTLWWNDISTAPGNPERRNICYCPKKVGTPWRDQPNYSGDTVILDAQPSAQPTQG
eukprot:gb/GEZN01000268.1/.p1 GENE.gb/GEZN01000268.1/~~gb/GEZN01000268.1/.p1  ORF type:complete len:1720 (+),score=86.51 gb/GEZN01000268.1/:80-5161(+)